METSIHQMMWGSRAESEFSRALNGRDPFKLLSERIQQALSTKDPMPLVRSISVAEEERLVDGLLCGGYCITVALSVEQGALAPDEARGIECQIEALLSVALLDLLTPIHVDFVAILYEGDH